MARGLDRSFLEHTTFGLGATARGYSSAREVWDAMAQRPGLAVVDATVAPRRDNWGFAVPPDFRLSGFYVEDGVFDPVPIQMRQTGRTLRLTVIGVLKDGAPLEMVGISASQETLQRAFRDGSCRRSTTSRSRQVSILKTPLLDWNQRSSLVAWKPSRSRRSSTTPSQQA